MERREDARGRLRRMARAIGDDGQSDIFTVEELLGHSLSDFARLVSASRQRGRAIVVTGMRDPTQVVFIDHEQLGDLTLGAVLNALQAISGMRDPT